jgi:ABC-type multidrug transport system fused ATPase/permease subunit
MESYSGAGTVAEEVISSIRTVFAFGGEDKELKRYEKNLLPAMKSGIKRNFVTGLGTALLWTCLYLGFALGIWFGVKLILQSKEDNNDLYTIGSILVIYWSVCGVGINIGSAAPSFEAIQIARGTAAQIFEVIERKPLIDSDSTTGLKPEGFEGNIEFRNVRFNYPMRPEVQVLNDLNLMINSRQTIALVGPSGCGKSTVIQLIQRFYDSKYGSVLIDGKNIKELNIGWLREQIDYVGQEPILFDTTIRENIALGLSDGLINDKIIEKAAIDANAHQFISQLPDKYETYVGDGGAQLSGGQKQRIAIARALIKNPKLLLLDEATAALDLENESLVQMAIDKNSKERTTIIVAHRLSTIIKCDKIFYIENGVAIECGTHSELMAKKGSYYGLVIAQQTQPNNCESDCISNNNENEFFDFKTRKVFGTNSFSIVVENEVKSVIEDEEALKQFSQIRLFKLLALDKFYIMIGLICSSLYGLVTPLYAYILSLLVEVFAETNDNELIRNESVKYAIYYIALAFGVGIVSVTQVIITLKLLFLFLKLHLSLI